MRGPRGCLQRLRSDQGTVTVVMAGVLGALTVLAVMLVAGLAGLRAGAQAAAAADAAALAAADALAGFPVDSASNVAISGSGGDADGSGVHADDIARGPSEGNAAGVAARDAATMPRAHRSAAPGVCDLAARVALANGATLKACAAQGACVLVTVTVTVTVSAGLPVTRSANAGPPAGCDGE